ncbi:hypothetical protein PENSUB_9228 [Penicillium subrubescens]|uniref:Uncharacterized protein n=1 Tax=Penicillium subrubescens TaxID=1316194 RepID=A0A1Q5TEA6_9EURO|nr:hypothetical protein PENSUB_9228 [Penicillium subrubescens]
MASQLDDRDTGVPEDPSDVPSHEVGQEELELSQQLENSKTSTPSTNTTCLNPEVPQRENIPVLCKVNPLGQCRNAKNDSESDASYEDQSEESDEDAEESNTDLGEEECNDGEEIEQSEEALESPAAGIIGHKRESEGIMRVLGPSEVTGLLRRTLYRLPSEKIIYLDEIQTVISKLDGGEFREAVRNSLSPFSKNTYPRAQVSSAAIFSPLEAYSALGNLQEDGYLGLRCFLVDALISWGTESSIKVLWKHIAKLGEEAQRWIENHARIELDKLRELAPITEEVLALNDE